MKPMSTLFLKAALFLIGMPVLALCVFLVPKIGSFAGELYPDRTYMKPLILLDMYAAALPFYYVLYQGYRILTYIDRNLAFSERSVKALDRIKYGALTISGLYLLGLPLYYLLADKTDAPGILPIAMTIVFASLVVAVFAAVLQRLLQEAISMKAENELTI